MTPIPLLGDLLYPIRATWPAHLILLNLIIRKNIVVRSAGHKAHLYVVFSTILLARPL
jgi:hypothetical protein